MTPAIDEPADRLLDALVDRIEARGDDEPGLARWAVEALADGLNLAVVVTDPAGPEDRLHKLTDALVDTNGETLKARD